MLLHVFHDVSQKHCGGLGFNHASAFQFHRDQVARFKVNGDLTGLICSFLLPFNSFHRGSFDLEIGFAAFQVLAFVELGFAFADAQGHFHLAVLPIQRERHEGIALDRGESEQFANFGFVQKQFARGFRGVVLDVAVRVFVNVGIVEVNLVVFDPRKGVTDLSFSGPKGLDLGAAEDDSRLKSFQDVEIAPRLGIADDLGADAANVFCASLRQGASVRPVRAFQIRFFPR